MALILFVVLALFLCVFSVLLNRRFRYCNEAVGLAAHEALNATITGRRYTASSIEATHIYKVTHRRLVYVFIINTKVEALLKLKDGHWARHCATISFGRVICRSFERLTLDDLKKVTIVARSMPRYFYP